MTMQEIITKLEQIQQELLAIDLTKDMKPEEIKKMADIPLTHVDEVTKEEEFGDKILESTVTILGNASSKIAYDPTKDNEEAIKDRKNREDIKEKVRAKKYVVSKIKGKYEELTRKQAIIDKYKEKFNPDELTRRQERKHEINKNKMADNEARWQEVEDFKSKVSEEIDTINNNLMLMKELDDIEEEYKRLQDAKKDLEEEKKNPDNDKDFLDQYQDYVAQQESEFNNKLKTITGKYKSLKLDTKTLESDIEIAKKSAREGVTTAKGSIYSKLTDADSKYGYKKGFESYIKRELDAAKTDEEYINVFDRVKAKLEAENINLGLENNKIQGNINTLEKGVSLLNNPGKTMRRAGNPTENEIQNMIKNDPECQEMIRQLHLPVDKKQMRKAVYESLTEGKKGLHLISFLKSFRKDTQDQWLEDKMESVRNMAIRKINENNQADADAVKVVEGKRKKFMQSLVSRVVNADDKALDQMEKNAINNPGEILTDIYKELDDDNNQR